MATTIKLGKRPKHLIKPVEFPMIDPDTGKPDTGRINCTYRYRTQREFGAWLDAKAAEQGFGVGEIANNEALYESICKSSAASILEVLDAWDVPDQVLSAESVAQLINEIPAAGVAILTSYREAIVEGRLGN